MSELKVGVTVAIISAVVLTTMLYSGIVSVSFPGSTDATKCLLQRNDLSRVMNNIAQMKSILSCELKKEKLIKEAILATGGWCEQNIDQSIYHHATDESLINALAVFFEGKTVGSFGDGRGEYKTKIDKTGMLKGYDAYDGGPYYDKTSNGSVKYLDLSLPQYGLPLYDYIMSLEVAEHIPQQFEAIYLSNVVRHAKEGIVLSWAAENQVGQGHVNGRSFEYVNTTLRALGFNHDPIASEILKNKSSVWWLKNNVNVYKRRQDSPVDTKDI